MEMRDKLIVGALSGLISLGAAPATLAHADTTDGAKLVQSKEHKSPGFFERLFGSKNKDKCSGKDACKAKDASTDKDQCSGKDACKTKDASTDKDKCSGKDACKAKDASTDKDQCSGKDACKAKQ